MGKKLITVFYAKEFLFYINIIACTPSLEALICHLIALTILVRFKKQERHLTTLKIFISQIGISI